MFPTRVLVAVDGLAEAENAARQAADLSEKTGSELHMTFAVPMPRPLGVPEGALYDPDIYDRLREMAEETGGELLRDQARRLPEGSVAETHLKIGRPDHHVTEVAEGLGAGLIVVGSRGRGPLRRVLLGSVSDSVLHHAHCPVLVVRDASGGEGLFGGRILLAVDGSPESDLATEAAAELAKAADAELHVVFALSSEPQAPFPHPLLTEGWEHSFEEIKRRSREFVEEHAGRLESERGLPARAHFSLGPPAPEIVELAEELGAGLVVLGSRGLGGVRRALLGSVSNAVVHHAHCPVLVARAHTGEPRSDGASGATSQETVAP